MRTEGVRSTPASTATASRCGVRVRGAGGGGAQAVRRAADRSRREPDGAALAGFLPNGRPDTTFGRNGLAVLRTPGTEWAIAVQASGGRIMVPASGSSRGPVEAMALALARFLPNGQLDRSFAGDGVTVTKPRPHWAGAIQLGVRRDGRIVVGTHGQPAHGRGFALVQFRRNGSIDRSFGDGGSAVGGVGFGVHALALDDRGRHRHGRENAVAAGLRRRALPPGRAARPQLRDHGRGLRRGRHAVRAVLQRDGKGSSWAPRPRRAPGSRGRSSSPATCPRVSPPRGPGGCPPRPRRPRGRRGGRSER